MPPAEPPPQETRARVGLQLRDEVGHGLDVAAGGDDDRLLLAGQPGDRGDHRQVDGRVVGEDGADHDVAADDQALGVALGLVDELGEADGAAGAGDVGHLDVAGDAFLLHQRLHGARGLVPAAAGGGRREDRVVGGPGGNAGEEQRGERERFHLWFPPKCAGLLAALA